MAAADFSWERKRGFLQVSDDAERSVLVKLKTECGYQFTSKLESMFTDIKTSRDMMQDYKAKQREQPGPSTSGMDLSVQASGTPFFSILAKGATERSFWGPLPEGR